MKGYFLKEMMSTKKKEKNEKQCHQKLYLIVRHYKYSHSNQEQVKEKK